MKRSINSQRVLRIAEGYAIRFNQSMLGTQDVLMGLFFLMPKGFDVLSKTKGIMTTLATLEPYMHQCVMPGELFLELPSSPMAQMPLLQEALRVAERVSTQWGEQSISPFALLYGITESPASLAHAILDASLVSIPRLRSMCEELAKQQL